MGELAIKNGAEDYVPKSFMNQTLLTRTIKYSIERNRLHQKIKEQANQDPLTKIPNRSMFFDKLEGLLEQSRRNFFSIAFVMIDLDDFKTLNDQLGHHEGNERILNIEISVSIGVSIWNTEESSQQLISRADQALYKSKQSGKGTITLI